VISFYEGAFVKPLFLLNPTATNSDYGNCNQAWWELAGAKSTKLKNKRFFDVSCGKLRSNKKTIVASDLDNLLFAWWATSGFGGCTEKMKWMCNVIIFLIISGKKQINPSGCQGHSALFFLCLRRGGSLKKSKFFALPFEVWAFWKSTQNVSGEIFMNSRDVMSLGLGLEFPWEICRQILNTNKNPHELQLTIKAERGSEFPCPVCGCLCKPHDFKEMTWRHLNFFQHHCYVTAAVPSTGLDRIKIPWVRKGSRFTLLFEQASMLLVREIPVPSAARIMQMADKRLWRIVLHYVNQAGPLRDGPKRAEGLLAWMRPSHERLTGTSPCLSTLIGKRRRWCLPFLARAGRPWLHSRSSSKPHETSKSRMGWI